MRKTNRSLAVVGLVLSLSMGALEATVVSTAMPTVIGDLGGIRHYAWVTTAYLLTSTVTVPIYGKLADTFGRKPLILLGIVLFLLGSAASGAAQSMNQLIAFRALQGLGAGAMQPMALTIVGDIFDLKERARMQGVFGAAWGVSGLIGPMLGAFIVDTLSWHWVFYINIPFGVAAGAILVTQLHETIEKKPHKLDFTGAAVLSAGVIALLAAASDREHLVPLLALALVLLGGFLWVERRAAEPVLPLDLFSQPVLAVSSLAGAIIGGAMIATMTFVPLFVQGVLGGSPKDAGSAITPMVIAWPLASAIGGRLLPRLGFRPLIRWGLGITAAGAVCLALFAEAHGVWVIRGATAMFGMGMGLANTALLIAVQSSVRWEQRGIATASTMFFRTIGGTLAVGVMGGVLVAALAKDPTIPVDAASRILSQDRGKSLDAAVMAHLSLALSSGLGTIFMIIAGMAMVAFFVSLWFPHVATETTPPANPLPVE